MKVSHSKLIENQHLNEQGILLATDAMLLDRMKELPQSVQNHLEECAKCRNEVFDYYQFRIEEDTQEMLPHPYFDKPSTDKTKERSLNKTWVVAASIVLLLGMTFMFYKFTESLPQKKDIAKIQEKEITDPELNENLTKKEDKEVNVGKIENDLEISKKSIEDKKIENTTKVTPKENKEILEEAIQYQTSAYFEKQISHTLNNPVRNNYLKVLNPKIGSILNQNITFEFDKKSNLDLELRIFTATHKSKSLIFKIPKDSNTFEIPNSLSPDLYYWELKRVYQGRKTRVGLGKFIVKNK